MGVEKDFFITFPDKMDIVWCKDYKLRCPLGHLLLAS